LPAKAASLALQCVSPCATLDFSAGPHFSFDSIGSKKGPGKLVLREESVGRGLHSMSALTPYLKIVAIVCAISACTPVK